MSTRSIIARVGEHEGQFAGRYVHSDGMPTSMGAMLWTALHGHFKNDLSAMLAYLIDAKHAQCGWSALVGKDFRLKPGYTWQKATEDGAKYEVYSKRPDYCRPQCFAGRAGEEPYLFTEKDLESTDTEYLYVFDETERKLFVRDISAKEDVAVIDLNCAEPNWSKIECGENFERCGHLAWYHNLVPKTCNLGTQTWLGNCPLDSHDAVAVIIGGKRLTLTGSGYSSEYSTTPIFRKYNPNTPRFPPRCWIATVKAGNGHCKDVPIARILKDGKYVPYPGVVWVFPPTKNNPQEMTSDGMHAAEGNPDETR